MYCFVYYIKYEQGNFEQKKRLLNSIIIIYDKSIEVLYFM